MNCKPGDLAVIVSVDGVAALDHMLGQIRRVSRLQQAWDGPAWEYLGERFTACGLVCEAIPDRWLRPIRDSDGTDETLIYAGKPRELEQA